MELANINYKDKTYIFIRSCVGLLLLYLLGIGYGVVAIFVCSVAYNYCIAYLMGLVPLTLTDLGMFCEAHNNRTNICCLILIEKLSYEEMLEICKERNIKPFPKFREKIVKVLGSYYAKPISVEEASKQLIRVEEDIHSKSDIERFLTTQLNAPFEIGTPQWRAFFIENYTETQSVIAYFGQHYLLDGLSGTFFVCAMNDTFDQESVPEMPRITFWKKVLMSVFALYYIPRDLFKYNLMREDKNPVNNQKPIDGRRIISLSKEDFSLNEMKKFSKAHGLTVNGYMMGIISKSFNDYFQKYNHQDKTVKVCLPISVRFDTPKSVQDIDMHNMISGMIYTLPIVQDLKTQTRIINKLTGGLRSSYEWFSANYLGRFWVAVLPIPVMFKALSFVCKKCTLIFSNVIGPKKIIKVNGKNIKEMYALLNGNPGIGFCVLLYTYEDKVTFSICSDINRMSNTKEFEDIIVQNIRETLQS